MFMFSLASISSSPVRGNISYIFRRVGSDHRPGRILDLRILVESQIMVDLVVNQERLCVSINLNWVDLKFSFWSKKSNDQAEGGKLWDDLYQCQLSLSLILPALSVLLHGRTWSNIRPFCGSKLSLKMWS